MSWDAVAALFARLCFVGPLLYIGLAMATDPESFVKSAAALAHVLEIFRQRVLRANWHVPVREFEQSPKQHASIRCAGVLIVIGAVAALVGAAV